MSKCLNKFLIEIVEFKGHENVRATHETTFEITREDYLTPRGDCIIGVSANKALADFSNEFKECVRNNNTKLIIMIISERGNYDVIEAFGNNKLTYEDRTRIIIRRSNYVSPNTAAIKANKAAKDLNRKLINDFRRGCKGIALFIAIRPS